MIRTVRYLSNMRHFALVFIAAVIGTVLTIIFSLLIFSQSGQNSHQFLTWNLTLAWLPLIFAFLSWEMQKSKFVCLFLLFWLAFFPNAPYLITDLIHYQAWNVAVSPWLDAVALLTAAITGMFLGLLSLYIVHLLLRQKIGGLNANIIIFIIIVISSLGVYIGRILRLNSWDIINFPQITRSLMPRLLNPIGHPLMCEGILLFSFVLGICYLFFYSFIEKKSQADFY